MDYWIIIIILQWSSHVLHVDPHVNHNWHLSFLISELPETVIINSLYMVVGQCNLIQSSR